MMSGLVKMHTLSYAKSNTASLPLLTTTTRYDFGIYLHLE